MDTFSLAKPAIFITGNTAITTSKDIAAFFRKPHNNILKKIHALAAECDTQWSRQHLRRVKRTNFKNGQPYFVFIISRDGFLLFALKLRDKQYCRSKNGLFAGI